MAAGRVLFVDDEEPLRHAVQQGLELAGQQVTCFAAARLAELAPPGMTPRIELSLTDEPPIAQAIVIISAIPDPGD